MKRKVAIRRRPRTYAKKVYAKKSFGKKSFGKKNLHLAKHVRIKNNGINATYCKWVVPKNKWMHDMQKRYFAGSKNIYQLLVPLPIGVATSTQSFTSFNIFGTALMNLALASINQGAANSTGNVTNTSRSYFERCDNELVMTNSSNGQLFVDIYVYRCKRDTANLPGTLWQVGMKDESNQGTTDYTAAWGVTPLNCDAVNQYWELKNVYYNTLNPGQTHTQVFERHLCTPIDNEMLNTVLQSDTNLEGKTHGVIVVVRGMVETASTASFIATDACKLNAILNTTTTFKYISDNTCNYTYSISSAFGTAGSIYNQGSGATVTAVGI